MNFALPNEANYLQIDHTSRCNLLCSQCSRVHQGQLNPSLPLDELSLQDYQNIFPRDSWPALKEIFFCGNFGDASVSESFLPALRYLRETFPQCILKFSTNGSARESGWWKDLAQVLHRKTDLVTFSIDGLAETNSIYRVRSRWEKIIENATAYIQAGGRARWDFIVFSHNEHQVEEARALAKSLGFYSFTVKKSNRFLKFEKSPVAPPQNANYQGQALQSVPEVLEKFGHWENYIKKTEIQCRFRHQEQRGLFLDFQARLWPCTWMAAPLHQHDEIEQKPYIRNLLDRYGDDFNSLRSRTVSDILNHPWFACELMQSWEAASDRSPTCARYCGRQVHYSSEHQDNRRIEKLQVQNGI